MWWGENGCGGMMGGWWFMPFFGLFWMFVFLYVISRIFGNGPVGRRYDTGENNSENIRPLQNEIHELRQEIKALRDNKQNNRKEDVDAP